MNVQIQDTTYLDIPKMLLLVQYYKNKKYQCVKLQMTYNCKSLKNKYFICRNDGRDETKGSLWILQTLSEPTDG